MANEIEAPEPRLARPSIGQSTVIGFVLVGAAVRVRQFAFNRSLWLDEAMLGNNFLDRSVGHLLTHQMDSGQSAPAGFIAIVGAWSWVAGTSDLAFRTVPFLAGLTTVFASVLIAAGAFRRWLPQVVLVALTACSPVLVYYSSEFKQYAVDVMITMIVLACLAHVDRWRHGVLVMGVVGAVAVWLSLPAIFIVAGCGFILVPSLISRDRWMTLLCLGGTWFASSAAALAWTSSTTEDTAALRAFWRAGFAPLSLDQLDWYKEHALGLVHLALRHQGIAGPGSSSEWFDGLNYGLFAVVVIGTLIGLVRPGPARRLMHCLGAATVLTLLASSMELYAFEGRLIIFLVPAVFLALAVLVDATAALTNPVSAVTSCALAATAVAIVIAPTAMTAKHPSNEFDIKGTLNYVERKGSGDQIAATGWGVPALRFYIDDYPFDWPPVMIAAPALDPEALLDEAAKKQPGRTWIIVSHRLDETRPLLEAVRSLTPQLDHIERDGAGAFLFDLGAPFVHAYETREASKGS